MVTNNDKGRQDTISETEINHRAGNDRPRLFAGLELFANAGDSDEEYLKLQTQIPTFWPLVLRGPFGPRGLDQPLEWPRAGQSLFRAFRDYLRRLWRSDFYKDDGSTVDGRYLQYVLGLETRYAVDPPAGLIDATLPDQAFRVGWTVLSSEHEGVYSAGGASVLPQWRSSKFEYVSSIDFQKAVYLLLSESWRAKVCRRCGKYFIADKAAQIFCSTSCSNQSKHETGRRYWHEKGTALRKQRIKKRGKRAIGSVGKRKRAGIQMKTGESK
jgi:hypothetical protein